MGHIVTDTYSKQTSAAVRALGRFLATPEGRKYLSDNLYSNDTPLVPADHSDAIGDVMRRVKRYDPPVIIAVHFPERPEGRKFVMVTVQPGSRPAQDKASRLSSIGMLADALMSVRSTVTFELTWEGALQASSYLASV